MTDLTDTQISKFEALLDGHKRDFTAQEFNANGVKGVYWTDLTRRPAEIKVAFRYEEFEGISGIQFLEPSQSKRVDHRLKAVEDRIAEIVGAGEISDYEMKESTIIRTFGLFGRDKADIGDTAWKSIAARAEKELSKKDAALFLETLDKEAFINLESKRLSLPFLQFESVALHKDAVKLAERPEIDWSTLSFYGKNDQTGLLRRQAAEIYPLFASYFANNSMFARRVIQKQQPLNAALADKLGLKEKALKRVQKKNWSLHGLSPEELGHALSVIPPDWIPQEEEEWESFCILTKTVGRKFGIPLGSVSPAPFDALYKGAKGKWREFHERCVLAFREDRAPQGMSPALADLIDKRIKKDRKALNKALRKGEPEFAREIGKLMSRFDMDSSGKADVIEWMRRSLKEKDAPLPAFNPEYADQLVADVGEKREDIEKALKAGDDHFERAASDIIGGYVIDDAFKESVRYWIDDLFKPDMSETFMDAAVEAALDLNSFVARHVVLPAAAHGVMENGNTEEITYRAEQRLACSLTAMQLLLLPEADNPGSGKSFPNFLEVVRDFHQNYAAIAEKVVGKGPDLSSLMNIPSGHWVPLFTGEVDLGGGIYAVCLTNEDELSDEGRRGLCKDGSEGNRHCVGGYGYQCKNNFQHIVSFRRRTPADSDEPFERIGTLQVDRVAPLSTDLKKLQYYRRGNQTPHDDARAAQELLFMKVKSKEVRLNHEQMTAFKEANGVIERDVVEAECHYKWMKKENITDAMFAVGKMIHSGFTKGENGIRNVDGLIQHKVLDGLLKKMDPVYDITGEGLRMTG
ncbi:hypothetical protein [Sulfitobacter sp. R18_1]|uniref:hypothetical protein n=1 Tax=Sulfitobacter sp. R18_1 TaxID=2821104 RepID=UPI001ADBE52C|nr:hypothetical protein [Sulfitobacter sp. R18_1]MBO9428444.1 hypothetical protein [Sulfitobacter sp. R18_1]